MGQLAAALYYGPTPVTSAIEQCEDLLAEATAGRTTEAHVRIFVGGLNALPGVSCRVPAGAFYAFPNVSGVPLSADAFAARLLEEAGVATLSGTAFGANGDGYLRLSYANSEANIVEALGRMNALIARL